MTHDQRAENVGAGRDLVVHDALVLDEAVVVATHFVQGSDGHVARAISVMHRGAVDRLAVFPNREAVGNREGLAMTDDHALNAVVRDPSLNPGVDAHARDADLVFRAALVLISVLRELLLVRAPAHLRGRGAFLAEALDAPGVDELVDLLRPVGDLGVSLAAMDDLDAQFLREVVELTGGDETLDVFRGAALALFVRNETLAMSIKPCFVKWEIRPGLAPCSMTAVAPLVFHFAVMRRRFMWR